jgi:hypothetical protein
MNIHHNRGTFDPFTLSQLLSDNFCNNIRVGTHICIAEIVFDCHINSPAVSYIQRKPHPEGILVWASSVKTPKDFPYILRLCPKTEEIVKTLNDGLKSSERKIYTMDSWFDSSSVKEYLESKGQYYILVAHTGRNTDLWSVAKDEFLSNTWRQYYNQQTNQMASIFSDHGIHCCLSNAYIPINLLNQSLEKCLLSERYKEQFNTVDLCDRRFYDCSFPHKRMKVNDVLFDGMLHITIINSFSNI